MKAAARIAWIRDSILRIADEWQPDEIGCEFFGVAAGANKQRAKAIETVWLHGNVHVGLAMLGHPAPLFVAPATLKKWMTGRGAKVEKPEVIAALKKRYGVIVEEHNAADAACVAFMLHDRERHLRGLGPLKGSAFSEYELEKMIAWERAFH